MEKTGTEERAIAELQKIATDWPRTLWLYTNGNRLYVMRYTSDGQHAITESGGIDPDFIVDEVFIDIDGGDW